MAELTFTILPFALTFLIASWKPGVKQAEPAFVRARRDTRKGSSPCLCQG